VAQALVWGWKARKPYCDAILCYSTRIALDGSPSGETVDDEARAVAREQLRAAQEATRGDGAGDGDADHAFTGLEVRTTVRSRANGGQEGSVCLPGVRENVHQAAKRGEQHYQQAKARHWPVLQPELRSQGDLAAETRTRRMIESKAAGAMAMRIMRLM
jgi:hypothetical protein